MTVLTGVFGKKMEDLAKNVGEELSILKHYVNGELVIYQLMDGFCNYRTAFANTGDAAKFFVYFELSSWLGPDVLNKEFYDRVIIDSFYDYYDFLPDGDTISIKVEAYTDPCEYFRLWYQPLLSELMCDFNPYCSICSDFEVNWREFMSHKSVFSFTWLFGNETDCPYVFESNRPVDFDDKLHDHENLQDQLLDLGIRVIHQYSRDLDGNEVDYYWDD